MNRIFTTIASLLACIIMSAANKDASINIDSRVKFQHVTGFGGFSPSPQWAYWLGDAEMDKLFGKGENQLGLNIVRLYISNSKNGWNSGVANAKRAKKYGAFVFASPWAPPASWKTNNSDSNGGSLLESRYKDWAVWLNDYYKYMKQQGAVIDAVSIQNEPDWKAEYQSCIWTGEQMAKFLKLYGSLIECKIIAPEAIHFTRSMHEPILNDPEACQYLDILGGHFYGWDGSSYPLAAQKGKEVWMTEYLINERQQNEKKNINWKDDGFLFARSVNDAMLANMSAWVHYSLKRYYGCLGDGEFGTTNNQITKRGYILSHYAKYVSGTTRIRHSLVDNTGKLSSSAYLTETGDSIVVMVLNQSADSYSTTITLPFYTANGRSIVTTETKNMEKSDLTWEEDTYQPVISVQPYSVSTYIFVKKAVRTDIEDVADDANIVFADNYDLSGASCIPTGWKAKYEDGTRSAGSYSLGPRIMSFSPEGMMTYGFYFRTGTSGAGYVSYGEDSKSRLTLEPGDYTLYFSTVGWKVKPSITATVQKVGGANAGSVNATPQSIISANGSSSRITSTTDKKIDFTVTETGNYILKWQVAKASTSLNEAIVGNIKLVKHATTAIIPLPAATTEDGVMYDLSGRRVKDAAHPGIYISNGKKVMIRK